MIKASPKVENTYHLSTQARMKFKSACMHNDWNTFETMLCEAGRMAMNEMGDNNYLDPKDFILTKGRTFECICPYCQGEISLHLDEVENG